MRRTGLAGAIWVIALAVAVLPGSGEPAPFVPEAVGRTATLPPFGAHWVFVPDRLLGHSALFDGDRGEMLGAVSSPSTLTPKLPLVSRARGEIYSVDLDYDRGLRGHRIDYVTVHDARTLDVTGEVVLPHPVSMSNTSLHHASLLDGDRFLVVFSQFPVTVATVVDLERREVVADVHIAGCAGVYAAGPRRFATLCGDGTAALALLDGAGRLRELVRSEPFFDVVADPVAMAGARNGTRWVFASFAGQLHAVDFGGDVPQPSPPWPLASESERGDGWRPGGLQPLAVHARSNRLYVLMHRGGAGSHKDPGPEIWTFDLAAHEREGTIAVPNLAAAFLGPTLGIAEGSIVQTLLRWLVPNQGAQSIAVTRDEAPLLFARHGGLGAVAVIDARTGEHLRTLTEAGLSGPTLGVY